MKNKHGFTLIELLAVIVVLAIVMVLAATTVLPYMTEARQESFALEANAIKDAAKNAISLISVGKLSADYYTLVDADQSDSDPSEDDYCFDVSDLKNAGLFEKDDESYKGIVVAIKKGNSYTYTVRLKNSEYAVNKEGNISKDDIISTLTGVKTACENGVIKEQDVSAWPEK